MRNLVDKVYDIFSSKLSKWFIFVGICCAGLYAFIQFVYGVSVNGSEAFYYIVYLAFLVLIVTGIIVGHYRSKEPLLFLSLSAYITLITLFFVVNGTLGVDGLDSGYAPYILVWVFGLINALALGCFIVSLALVYLFKIKRVAILVKISFLVSLFTGILTWVFGIVFAANGAGWNNAVLPLFVTGSLLMLPGLFEELFPGDLDVRREESEEEA